MMRFAHLRVHSEYSSLEGACRIESLVRQAKERGFHALALTDKNVMYGTIPFYKTCLQAGVKPIIGLEAQVTTGSGTNQQSYPIVLLAKNLTGYRNLLKISTHIQMKSSAKEESIDIRTLRECSLELFALSGGMEGEIGQCLLHGEFEQALVIANIFKNTFQDGHFFLEVEDHGMREEKKVNEQLLELSARSGLPLMVANNVHYIDKNDARIHEALLAIKRGTTIAPVKSDQFYLKSRQEMASAIPEPFREAMENSAKIADQCDLKLPLGHPVLPKFPLPEGWTSKEALVKLCEKGLNQRYNHVTNTLLERLRYELAVIDKMGFNDYFLIVWDFMRFARKNGITTGPGRGSVAGSLVAYVLYITNVDPIEHELLFERFLNPERVSMPDIDIDFPDTRRDEVIAYVADKYGAEHVAHIITFGTLGARAAVRDVGRILDLAPKLVDQFAKHIPTLPGMTLEKAYRESPELRKLVDQSDEAKRLYELANSVEGFPRHASTHAAGIVISQNPLTDIVPLKAGHGTIPLTQFPMEDLEEIGLLKMDFLGLRNLSLLEDIQKNIEQIHGKNIRLHDIPFDDQKTFALLSSGDTTGIFQLESQGMRNVLKRLKPSEFEDIVAVNALYRPGPMEQIPTYIDAKHGRKNVTYPHPDLAPILKKTYGVIVYQEQIMQIASTMAGFSLGEADLLRRAVSKKKRDILEKERAHFIAGCLKKGYSEQTAHTVYQLLVRFADYGFNRSHAVAYSMIAYQLAYLKANYPLEFFAALLSSVIGNDHKLASYVTELKKRQIKVLPPSINDSDMTFTVHRDGIRFGLSSIKHIGIQALQELIDKRKTSGRYRSLFDVCQRVSLKIVNKRALESLILAGACDEFGIHRASLLATLDEAVEFGEKRQRDRDQIAFFHSDTFDEPAYVDVPPFTEREKLSFEKEAVGFYVSGHPIEQHNTIRRKLSLHRVIDLNAKRNQQLKTAVFLEEVRTIKTKKGERMAFLKVSDDTGEIEVIVFPNLYKRVGHDLQKDLFLLIAGHVEEKDQSVKLIAETITRLDEGQTDEKKLFLKIDKHHHHPKTLALIKAILAKYPGEVDVVLYYEEEKQLRNLSRQFSVSGSDDCLRELADLLGKTNLMLK